MTREQIEKEARGYIRDVYAGDGYFLPDYEEEVRDGFIAGAQWLADRLCHLPLDKLAQELAEYINQKEVTK